jgi:hypothetical protein
VSELASIRITYRTGRVLAAIGDWVPTHRESHPSNRAVANEAGIGDEGQASKLLKRLAARDLIENTGETHPPGGANAWRLTPGGEEVLRALRSR